MQIFGKIDLDTGQVAYVDDLLLADPVLNSLFGHLDKNDRRE